MTKRSSDYPAVTHTRSYRYGLDPSPEESRALSNHIGASRFAYNHLLSLVLANWEENRAKKERGEEVTSKVYLKTSHFDLVRRWYSIRDDVAPWWGENGAISYNDAAQRLSRAFANFHQGRTKIPRHKKKGPSGSVRFTGQCVSIFDTHHVRISRVGVVKTYESTRKPRRHVDRGTGRIVAASVNRSSGWWWVSFSVEMYAPLPETRAPGRVIGIDRGLESLYVGADTTGEELLRIENPKFLDTAQSRLTRLQRQASRRQGPRPGQAPSKRWRKANARVQTTHARVANQRRGLIHHVTTRLAKDYDRIMIEDLNVKGMVKNHHLARAIYDASWSEFTRQLTYKTQWYGSELVLADRFYPSSKTCSHCGAVRAKLLLSERVYECEACGLELDRDRSAAINLARWASSTTSAGTNSVAGRGGEVRPNRGIRDEAHPNLQETSTETLTQEGA